MIKTITQRGILLAAFMMLLSIIGFAQSPPVGPPPSTGGVGGDPPCWDPPCIPIDGGIWFLLLAGTLLGVRLLYTQRASKNA